MGYSVADLERIRVELSNKLGRDVTPEETLSTIARVSGTDEAAVRQHFGLEKNTSYLGDMVDAAQEGGQSILQDIASGADYVAAQTRHGLLSLVNPAIAAVSKGAEYLTGKPTTQVAADAVGADAGRNLPSGVSDFADAFQSGHLYSDAYKEAYTRLHDGLTPEADRRWEYSQLTPETQAQQAEVDATSGFGDRLATWATNPRALGMAATENLARVVPEMTVAGAGLAAAGVRSASALAGGAEGLTEIPAMMQGAQHYNAEHGGGDVTDNQLLAATGVATATGLLGAASYKVAEALGGVTVDKYIADTLLGNATSKAASGFMDYGKRIGVSAAVEGATEGLQTTGEMLGTTASNEGRLGLGANWDTQLADGIALGTAMGGAIAAAPRRTGREAQGDFGLASPTDTTATELPAEIRAQLDALEKQTLTPLEEDAAPMHPTEPTVVDTTPPEAALQLQPYANAISKFESKPKQALIAARTLAKQLGEAPEAVTLTPELVQAAQDMRAGDHQSIQAFARAWDMAKRHDAEDVTAPVSSTKPAPQQQELPLVHEEQPIPTQPIIEEPTPEEVPDSSNKQIPLPLEEADVQTTTEPPASETTTEQVPENITQPESVEATQATTTSEADRSAEIPPDSTGTESPGELTSAVPDKLPKVVPLEAPDGFATTEVDGQQALLPTFKHATRNIASNKRGHAAIAALMTKEEGDTTPVVYNPKSKVKLAATSLSELDNKVAKAFDDGLLGDKDVLEYTARKVATKLATVRTKLSSTNNAKYGPARKAVVSAELEKVMGTPPEPLVEQVDKRVVKLLENAHGNTNVAWGKDVLPFMSEEGKARIAKEVKAVMGEEVGDATGASLIASESADVTNASGDANTNVDALSTVAGTDEDLALHRDDVAALYDAATQMPESVESLVPAFTEAWAKSQSPTYQKLAKVAPSAITKAVLESGGNPAKFEKLARKAAKQAPKQKAVSAPADITPLADGLAKTTTVDKVAPPKPMHSTKDMVDTYLAKDLPEARHDRLADVLHKIVRGAIIGQPAELVDGQVVLSKDAPMVTDPEQANEFAAALLQQANKEVASGTPGKAVEYLHQVAAHSNEKLVIPAAANAVRGEQRASDADVVDALTNTSTATELEDTRLFDGTAMEETTEGLRDLLLLFPADTHMVEQSLSALSAPAAKEYISALHEVAGSEWRDLLRKTPRFSINKTKVRTPAEPNSIRAFLGQVLGKKRPKWVVIHPTTKGAEAAIGNTLPTNTAAFVYGGQVHFVVENIDATKVETVVMHEIGAHIAMENYTSRAELFGLAEEISAAAKTGDTVAQRAVQAAKEAVNAVGGAPQTRQMHFISEVIGYYVEYAGVKGETNNSIAHRILSWLRDLLEKVGIRLGESKLKRYANELLSGALQRMRYDDIGVDASVSPLANPVNMLLSAENAASDNAETVTDFAAQRAKSVGLGYSGKELHETEIGKASLHRRNSSEDLEQTSEAISQYLRGQGKSLKGTLRSLDVGTMFIKELLVELNEYKPKAVREAANAEDVPLIDRKLLPSASWLDKALRGRDAMVNKQEEQNKILNALYNSVSDDYRDLVGVIMHDSRAYGLWAVDPSSWHIAFNEDKLKTTFPDMLDENGELPKKTRDLITERRKAVQKSVKEQIALGNKILSHWKQNGMRGKPPIPDRLVAWKLHMMRKGLDFRGRKLSETRAADAARAAATIEEAFRSAHNARLQEQIAIEASVGFSAMKTRLERLQATKEQGLATDEAKLDKQIKAVKADLKQLNDLRARSLSMVNPYVPHVRVGDKFVAVRSDLARFTAATKAVGRAARQAQQIRGELEERTLALQTLEANTHTDPNHVTTAKRKIAQLTHEMEVYESEVLARTQDVQRLLGRLDKYKTEIYGKHITAIQQVLDDDVVSDPAALEDALLENAKLRKAVSTLHNALMHDADHNAFFSFTSEATRQSFLDDFRHNLQKDGNPNDLEASALDNTGVRQRLALDHETLLQVETMMKRMATSNTQKELAEELIHRMFLEAYASTITVKSKNTYRGIYGFDPANSVEVLSKYNRETARYVAAIHYNTQIENILSEMGNEAMNTTRNLSDEDRIHAARLWQSLMNRWDALRDPRQSSPLVEGLLTTNTIMALTTNPSYFMINAMQFLLMAVPVISQLRVSVGGKLISASAANVAKHAKAVSEIMTTAFTHQEKALDEFIKRQLAAGAPIEPEKISEFLTLGRLESYVRKHFRNDPELVDAAVEALKRLEESNLMDMGLNTDMGNADAVLASLPKDSKAAAGAIRKIASVNTQLRGFSQRIEAANRSASMLLSVLVMYDAAKRSGKSVRSSEVFRDKVIDRALDVVRDTQGDYSRTGAPTWFNSKNAIARMALQFRKFGMVQARFLARMIKHGFLADAMNLDVPKEERVMYRRMLGATLLWTTLMLGARGLPIAAVGFGALAAMGLVGADDDQEDVLYKGLSGSAGLEHWIRVHTGDSLGTYLANGLLGGASGTDISTRAGFTNVFGIMPFDSESVIDLFTSDKPEDLLVGTAKLILGSPGNTLGRAVAGMNIMADADFSSPEFWRGMAYASPAGLRNLIYAKIWDDQGVKTKSGNTLVSREELTTYDLMMRGLGFQPKKVADVYEANSAKYKVLQTFNREASRIKRNYYNAYLRRDNETMKQYSEEWRDYVAHRRAAGIPGTPSMGALQKYVHNKLKTDRTQQAATQAFKP